MVLDRVMRESKSLSDLPIRQAIGKHPQHGLLACGELWRPSAPSQPDQRCLEEEVIDTARCGLHLLELGDEPRGEVVLHDPARPPVSGMSSRCSRPQARAKCHLSAPTIAEGASIALARLTAGVSAQLHDHRVRTPFLTFVPVAVVTLPHAEMRAVEE